ncbi:MAG: thiosulfate oxidation carrier protein SoxY, partial [Deltaproteobacteria bacterium]|nr:thiosulfate oxidation carrier protein SoxY [Deltaproteobacteria bacterium]
MKQTARWILLLFSVGFLGLPAAKADENELPALNAGIDQLAFQLTRRIAEQYFDTDKRPVVKVAVFDFTDPEGNVTAGSRYVSTRIRLAFAKGLQFELLTPVNFENEGFVATARAFSENRDVRERTLDMLKADAYIFGTVAAEGSSNAACDIKMWGLAPPFDQWSRVKPIGFESPNPWKLGFSPSGTQFFSRVVLRGAEGVVEEMKRDNLGKVLFLSQPICDDLSLSWQIRSDGMVYDMRKESKIGSLRDRTGQVLQNRVKSEETLKEVNYIIRDFTLIINEKGGESFKYEPYVLAEKSDYYFM